MKTIIKKFAIDMRIRVGYGTAFFLLLISYLLTLYANWELLKQSRLVEHTNRVILHLETIVSSLKDAESGVRGYLLMKNEIFLNPFQKSRPAVDSAFDLVKRETQDNHLMQIKLNAIHDLIEKKFETLAFAIDYFPRHHYEITDTLRTKAYFGNQLMEHIRENIDQLKAVQQDLLKQRSNEMQSRYNALNTIVVTSLVLAGLLVIYGFFTYSRENIARRKADQTVFEYQEQLKEQIDELNTANKELVQMRSIEKLAATGRIARTIAHEVRNPLTNINLSVDQLKMEIDGDNENITQMLDMITRNSSRINQLITDLLNSTKFTELVYQKVSVNQLLDETLELAKDRMQLNNIKVQKSYTEDICAISVDIERIKIAFLNIIVNAIEAMHPDEGILQIKTESKEEKCVVTIADNGSGIDKESLSKLFEPYFTSKPRGTGLGLTNAQNIILNHNGHIHVESEPGKGTRFIITLDFA
jgi:signal transduction histidine kinase